MDIIFDNCVLDTKNRIKIPQNEDIFFSIKKSKEWNFSIEISLDPNKPVNINNFFLIIKSYMMNKKYYAYGICSIIKKNNDEIVSENINLNFIKRLNVFEFEDWIKYRLSVDKKYLDENSFYCFRIMYNKEIIEKFLYIDNIDVLEILKPKYPWNKKIIFYNEKDIIIEKLKKEIRILKKHPIYKK